MQRKMHIISLYVLFLLGVSVVFSWRTWQKGAYSVALLALHFTRNSSTVPVWVEKFTPILYKGRGSAAYAVA